MPTVTCKECGNMVSPTAETCPHCGVKHPASYLPSKAIIHREPSFVGALGKIGIFVDGNKVGDLAIGDSIETQLSSGDHKIAARAGLNGTSRIVTILPSRVYHFELSFPLSGMQIKWYIESDI